MAILFFLPSYLGLCICDFFLGGGGGDKPLYNIISKLNLLPMCMLCNIHTSASYLQYHAFHSRKERKKPEANLILLMQIGEMHSTHLTL